MKEKLLLLALPLSLLLSSCYFFRREIDNSTYVNSPLIEIPNLHLKSFPKKRKDILLKYLASSSDWHVTSVNGSLLALKREDNERSCKKPMWLDRPSNSASDGIFFLALPQLIFNFSPEVGISRLVKPENRVKENETVSLKMEKMQPPYGTSYKLIIENQDKSLELFQKGQPEDFKNKRLYNILTGVSRELEKLANSKSMNSQEIDPSILPPGSVKYSKNQIVSIKKDSSLPTDRHNQHIVSGYINLGRKGFVYSKAIKKENGEILFTYKDGANVEYVGWSSDPNQKFNFCINVDPGGGTSKKPDFLADIQIWFHPSDGSPETMLHQQTLRLNVQEIERDDL
jgi:hypothetical protein